MMQQQPCGGGVYFQHRGLQRVDSGRKPDKIFSTGDGMGGPGTDAGEGKNGVARREPVRAAFHDSGAAFYPGVRGEEWLYPVGSLYKVQIRRIDGSGPDLKQNFVVVQWRQLDLFQLKNFQRFAMRGEDESAALHESWVRIFTWLKWLEGLTRPRHDTCFHRIIDQNFPRRPDRCVYLHGRAGDRYDDLTAAEGLADFPFWYRGGTVSAGTWPFES